jgi:hypothetical protein
MAFGVPAVEIADHRHARRDERTGLRDEVDEPQKGRRRREVETPISMLVDTLKHPHERPSRDGTGEVHERKGREAGLYGSERERLKGAKARRVTAGRCG